MTLSLMPLYLLGGLCWSEALLSALEERNANIPQQENKMWRKLILWEHVQELVEKVKIQTEAVDVYTFV